MFCVVGEEITKDFQTAIQQTIEELQQSKNNEKQQEEGFIDKILIQLSKLLDDNKQ